MDAIDIASRTLRENYGERGILAGRKNYSQYWLRDGAFASFGSLSLGDREIVGKALREFGGRTKKGMVPMRIRGKDPGWMFWDRFSECRYRTDKPPFSEAVDTNPLYIIALENYVRLTGDEETLREVYGKAKEAIGFLEEQEEDGLLWQGLYGDWADTLSKKGHVCYANVCYYRALEAFSSLSGSMGEDDRHYREKAKALKGRILETFWNGEYLEDFPGGNFDGAANALACLWLLGEEDRGHAEKIFGVTEKLRKEKTPLPSVHPPYDGKSVSWDARLALNEGFHNGDSWLWIGCIDAVAKKRFGFDSEAKEEVWQMARIIEEYGGVYEVYHQDRPTSTKGSLPALPFYPFRGYDADEGWSWSAGLFVWAWKEVMEFKKESP